jgi:hypothetical protein
MRTRAKILIGASVMTALACGALARVDGLLQLIAKRVAED